MGVGRTSSATALEAFLKESGSRVELVPVFDGKRMVQLREVVLPPPSRLLSPTHDWWAERADEPNEPEHLRQFYRTAAHVLRFWEATRWHHPGRKGPGLSELVRQARAEEWETGETARESEGAGEAGRRSRPTVWPPKVSDDQIRLALDDGELAPRHLDLLEQLRERDSRNLTWGASRGRWAAHAA